MRNYVFFMLVFFLMSEKSDAMVSHTELNSMDGTSGGVKRFSNKALALNEKESRSIIKRAQEQIDEPHVNFEDVLSVLKPLFNPDMSLVFALSDYYGEAHYLYGSALWASDKKEEATSWLFKAAEYKNGDALTSIGVTSPRALTLIQERKISEAKEQYNKDLDALLAKYRPDLTQSK